MAGGRVDRRGPRRAGAVAGLTQSPGAGLEGGVGSADAQDPAATVRGQGGRSGRIVAISVWAIHHNPAVWPDPYRFDSERFDRREAAGEV